jgi:hypothetical protein
MSSIYSKAHSAGWIDPDGKFMPIEADMIHDDMSANFPGVPMDEEFPSDYAVRNLGYLRVSNPFDFVIDEKPQRGDPRVERMAKFTADAILSYEKSGRTPTWLEIPFRSRGTPVDWEVKISQPGLRWETMTVGDFVDRYGSRETSDKLFGHFLGKLQERLLRVMIKRLIRESRRR